MIINKAEKFNFLSPESTSVISSTKIDSTSNSFDVVSAFEGDPFVGHLSTPITTSNLTKTYLSSLPAYQTGLSPLLRGINIGFVHGYFLLGPFVKLGPLRDSQVANFIGFVSTISLILILNKSILYKFSEGLPILKIFPNLILIHLFWRFLLIHVILNSLL